MPDLALALRSPWIVHETAMEASGAKRTRPESVYMSFERPPPLTCSCSRPEIAKGNPLAKKSDIDGSPPNG